LNGFIFLSVIDAVIRKIGLNSLQIAGTALVALAFVFMVMPDPWLSVKLRKDGQSSSSSSRREKKQRNGEIAAELQELKPKSPAKDAS
jgi:hypothetical protein